MSTTNDAPVASVPAGGTELMQARLEAALPDLCAQVQIICSRPEQVELDPNKPKILWLHDLPQDPASARLKDSAYRSQFNKLVFVSHWQQQMYAMVLGVPYHEGTVIKNAIDPLVPQFPKPKDGKLKFIYHSTPHRGLVVLAAAADALAKERQDWTLDVYSSLKLYGWDEADKGYEPLYEQLRANPCVAYHGTRSNEEIRQAVLDAHVWVYPSIYPETSALCAQEALMAGCLGICSNFGALPETCAEWAWMFGVDENAEIMAHKTHGAMTAALNRYDDPAVQQVLEMQSIYYQNFWSFKNRVPTWQLLLESVIAEGPRQEMVVFD